MSDLGGLFEAQQESILPGAWATYSPEDNKLRLYSTSRLEPQLYQRVREAGFIWAPKQELFVAPMWTPQREDLLIELCGEIGDEDTSLVDRAEERAGRFEAYSDRRSKDGDRAYGAMKQIADNIPMGQPILVGHHSERRHRKDIERIDNNMGRAVKMWETSKYWEARAKAALQHAEYKEQPHVRVRRIKTLEAELRSRQRDLKEYEARGRENGIAWAKRWIGHLTLRIAYEKAMLTEAGAIELLAKKPRPTQLPLLNYRAESIPTENRWQRGTTLTYRQVEMTQAEYAKIDRDYKGTREVAGSHRFRTAMQKHELVAVFLTDSKVHERPNV